MIKISQKHGKTTTYEEIGYFTDLNDFIENFPYTERQCIINIERELSKNGYFIFSDFDAPVKYQLLIIP